MRKLVLGIIALVAVQFAFVTYTMLLKSSGELIDGQAISRPVLNNPVLVKIDETVKPAEPEVAAIPVEPRHSRMKVAPIVSDRTAKREFSRRTRTPKPAFPPRRSETASQTEFTPVVIRYNRYPKAPAPVIVCSNRDTDPPERATLEVAKIKKRNYIAKVIPILKKPWDWLKFIGSKLN